jgi:hypothetical protein
LRTNEPELDVTSGETSSTTIDVSLDETDERTEAKAVLRVRDREFTGSGQARRNPRDPNVPEIGEELAIARALSDLSHQLVGAAADAIEAFEGRPVSLHP